MTVYTTDVCSVLFKKSHMAVLVQPAKTHVHAALLNTLSPARRRDSAVPCLFSWAKQAQPQGLPLPLPPRSARSAALAIPAPPSQRQRQEQRAANLRRQRLGGRLGVASKQESRSGSSTPTPASGAKQAAGPTLAAGTAPARPDPLARWRKVRRGKKGDSPARPRSCRVGRRC
jgi:hypothetical protein